MLAVVLGAGTAAAALSGSTMYRSTTVLMIDDPYSLATAGDSGPLLKLDQLRYKYAALATTEVIMVPISHTVRLPLDAVESAVTVEVPNAALLLDVVATQGDPTVARELSSVMAQDLIGYVHHEEDAGQIPASDRFTLSVVDPTSAAIATGPSHRLAASIGAGFALIGLIGGFTVTQLVRNRHLLVGNRSLTS